jgi:hypothetical protein
MFAVNRCPALLIKSPDLFPPLPHRLTFRSHFDLQHAGYLKHSDVAVERVDIFLVLGSGISHPLTSCVADRYSNVNLVRVQHRCSIEQLQDSATL